VCPVRVVDGGESDLVLESYSRSATIIRTSEEGRTLHARAVIIICVASREWMKLGGKAVACARASTSAGMEGSMMKTVWRAVAT
jgi:hypothetical protein